MSIYAVVKYVNEFGILQCVNFSYPESLIFSMIPG